MRIMEERVQVITHDSILGRSMYNVNKQAHDELARQMKEWESKKGNKVYTAKMGESGYGNAEAPRSKMGTMAMPDNTVKRNTKGKNIYMNLKTTKTSKFQVAVGSVILGSFELEEALRVRDSFRAKNGYPPAEDKICTPSNQHQA